MKRSLRFLSLAGAVAGAIWYARRQAEPRPSAPTGDWAGRPNLQVVPGPSDTSAPAAVPEARSAWDDLTEIKGIGPKYAEQLGELGITTFAALSSADPADLAEQFGPLAGVEDWIAQARVHDDG